MREGYGLDPDVLKFVLEYVVDFDAERAFVGTVSLYDDDYNEGYLNAKRLLTRPDVKSAIINELNYLGTKLLIKKEAIMARIWEEAINMRSKPGERLKALELLARMGGNLDFERGQAPPVVNITISDPSHMNVIKGDVKAMKTIVFDETDQNESE